jgi:hypothetical protein
MGSDGKFSGTEGIMKYDEPFADERVVVDISGAEDFITVTTDGSDPLPPARYWRNAARLDRSCGCGLDISVVQR